MFWLRWSVLLAALVATSAHSPPSLSLSFNETIPRFTVDKNYVNFNIDTGSLYNGLNFSDPKLITLVKQLAPATIRIGGTAVDSSFFFPAAPYNVGSPNQCAPPCPSGSSDIGTAMLDAVVTFIQVTMIYLFSRSTPSLSQRNSNCYTNYLLADYIEGHRYESSLGHERCFLP